MRLLLMIGTSADAIDRAEDRERFQHLIQKLGLKQPPNSTVRSLEQALTEAAKIGYPLVVRPSYVLGGQGMSIVINDEELEKAVIKLLKNLPGNRVLIDHFLDRAEEAEVDAIFDGDQVERGHLVVQRLQRHPERGKPAVAVIAAGAVDGHLALAREKIDVALLGAGDL